MRQYRMPDTRIYGGGPYIPSTRPGMSAMVSRVSSPHSITPKLGRRVVTAVYSMRLLVRVCTMEQPPHNHTHNNNTRQAAMQCGAAGMPAAAPSVVHTRVVGHLRLGLGQRMQQCRLARVREPAREREWAWAWASEEDDINMVHRLAVLTTVLLATMYVGQRGRDQQTLAS
jgi:hypothetical protein